MAAGLYKAGHWVTVVATDKSAENLTRLDRSVNLSIRIALIVVMVIMAMQALGELWKLARGQRAASFAV